jgi:hypothetical protein
MAFDYEFKLKLASGRIEAGGHHIGSLDVIAQAAEKCTPMQIITDLRDETPVHGRPCGDCRN